jgi:transposase
VMDRLVLSDAAWERMAPLIIGRPDQKGSTGRDNRMFVEGVLWIVRTGSPWRDLPEAFGDWNSVFRRFSRWSVKGVWWRIFEAMSDDPDFEYLIVDLYEGAAVKGISVAFSDLDSLLVTDLGARSSPAAAKRCANSAGLEGAPKSVTSSKRSPNILCRSSFCLSFVPIQGEPLRACGARRTNLYPAGYNPVPRSLMRVARARAPREMGPFSTAASFSHVEIRSHIHLGFISSFYRCLIFVRHPLRTAPRGTTPVSR